jgi:hypothetical protein
MILDEDKSAARLLLPNSETIHPSPPKDFLNIALEAAVFGIVQTAEEMCLVLTGEFVETCYYLLPHSRHPNINQTPIQFAVFAGNQAFFLQPVQQAGDGGTVDADVVSDTGGRTGKLLVKHIEHHPLGPRDILVLEALIEVILHEVGEAGYPEGVAVVKEKIAAIAGLLNA